MTTYAPEHIILQGIQDGSYDEVIDEFYSVVQERRMALGKTPRVRKRGTAPGVTGAGRSGRFQATPPISERVKRMKQLGCKDRSEYEKLSQPEQLAFVPIDNGRYYVAKHRRYVLLDETIELLEDVAGRRFHYLTLKVMKVNTKTVQCRVLTGTHDNNRNRYRGASPIVAGDVIRVPYSIAAKAYIRGAK